MADEDCFSDDVDRPYGSLKIKPNIQTTTHATSVAIKPSATIVTATSTKGKSKYGPPVEVRLKKTNPCIIFSNRFQKNPRHKALPQNRIDEENIERTFSWLNFDVVKNINFDSDQTVEAIKEICGVDYTDKECLVLFFITHGTKDRKFYANDMVKLSLDDDVIQKLINNVSSLQGKMKLIFVQACRGATPMEAVEESDGSEFMRADIKKKKAKDADTFIYFSTTEGYLAWGNDQIGSYFVDTLCGVLQEYGGDYPLGDVVTKVNEVLAEQVRHNKGMGCDVVEVGDVHQTLTRKLYFTPKEQFLELAEEEEGEEAAQVNVTNNIEKERETTVMKIMRR